MLDMDAKIRSGYRVLNYPRHSALCGDGIRAINYGVDETDGPELSIDAHAPFNGFLLLDNVDPSGSRIFATQVASHHDVRRIESSSCGSNPA